MPTHPKLPARRLRARGVFFAIALWVAGCSADPAVRKQEFVESGDRYFAAREYRKALLEYRNAVAIDATFGRARAGLAESHAALGDPVNALQEYVRAADLLPDDVELQLRAGTYLLAHGEADQALVRARAALKLQPSSVPAHILHGNALAGLSSFDDALDAIEQAIRLDPARGTTFTHKGIIELARGRRAEAEAAFRAAVELAPKSVEAQLALGNYYWAVGQPVATERAFRAALEIDGAHEAANRAMAALTFATDRPHLAEQYLRQVVDITKSPDAVFGLADYYMLMGRTADAVKRLEPLAAGEAAVPGAAQRLARAYALAGDRARAGAIVDEVLSRAPRDIDAQLLKGQLLLDEGRRDEALRVMRTAANGASGSVEAQYALGKLYSARGDAAAAEAAFRAVLKINPRVAGAHIELSRLLLSTGNSEASLRTAEEATRIAPADVGARLTLIRSLLSANDLDRAEREIRTLEAALPDLPEVIAQRGVLAVHRKDVAGARAAFERALVRNPDSMEAAAGLILLDVNARNFAAAKARLEGRVRGDGARPEWLVLAARTYASMQDLAASEQFLRRAIEIDPTLLPAYSMLGQLYIRQQRLDEARREFEALAERQTKPIAALTMSAIILQQQGDLALATKRFEQVLALDPRSAIAANNLAWIYVTTGKDLDAALQLALIATAASPDVPELMDTLGWIYYKKNLPGLAIPQLERAAAKAPGNAGYLHHLALAYIQSGQRDRGRALLTRAVDAGLGAPEASEVRALLDKAAAPATR